MPAGFKSAVHTHTEDYYAVVIEGVDANFPARGKATPLPVGSYWFQRGEEPHETQCLSKTGCLFFLVQPGAFDYVVRRESGSASIPEIAAHPGRKSKRRLAEQ
jgi:hypothetical protein